MNNQEGEAVKPTGIFLTAEEYAEVTGAIHHTMTIDLGKGMNVYETDKRTAIERLKALAQKKGLPDLGSGKGYGLASNREIVAP